MRGARRNGRGRWFGAAIVTAIVLSTGAVVAARSTGESFPASNASPTTLQADLMSFAATSALFLRVTTIPGDSIAKGHANDIDVQTFGWGVTNTTGIASWSDVTVTKFVDPASPLLMKAVAGGIHLQAVTLFAEKPGADPFEYFKLTLNDALVHSFSQSANRTSGIKDTVVFTGYSKITLRHVRQLAAGGTSVVEVCWDTEQRKVC